MCKMNLWNEKDLPMPPINTYKAGNTSIDIKYLYNVFNEGKQFFDSDKYMHMEYTVLSTVVYRMKQKFRSAKDFKSLEKLNKALKNYFQMNLSSNLKKFMDLIPSRYKDETYLPTKNLLDFILVRLQGLVKLMERIVETSKIAAYLFDKRMKTGHFWKIAFIMFSLASRVYILARHAAKFICEFYRKLLPFSQQLKNIKNDWLPENYSLPKDLKEWMNVDWLEFDDDVQIIEVPTELPDIIKFFDLVDDDDDDVQFCDEYFMVEDNDDDDDVKFIKEFKKIVDSKVKSPILENIEGMRGFDVCEDIGEVIEINDNIQAVEDNYSPSNTEETDITNHKRNRNLSKLNHVKVIDDTKLQGLNKELFPPNAGASCSDADIINDMDKIDVLQTVSKLDVEESSVVFSDSDVDKDIKKNNWILKREDPITISDVSTIKITSENNLNKKNIETKTKFEPNDIKNESDEEISVIVSSSTVIDKQKRQQLKNQKNSEMIIKTQPKTEANTSELIPTSLSYVDDEFCIQNSDGDSSVDRSIEESIVTISDTSLIDIKDNKLQIFNQQNTLVNDSDEDVITLSDTSVLETTEFIKKKKLRKSIRKDGRLLEKKKKKFNTSLVKTECDEENVIIPHTSLLDKSVKRKRKKLKKKHNSNEREEPGGDDICETDNEDKTIDMLEKELEMDEKREKCLAKKRKRLKQKKIKHKLKLACSSSFLSRPLNTDTKSKENIVPDISRIIKKKIKELETIVLKSINDDKIKFKKKLILKSIKSDTGGKKLKNKKVKVEQWGTNRLRHRTVIVNLDNEAQQSTLAKRNDGKKKKVKVERWGTNRLRDRTKIVNVDNEAQQSTSAETVDRTETIQRVNQSNTKKLNRNDGKTLDELALQRTKRNQKKRKIKRLRKKGKITKNVNSEAQQNSVTETIKEENSTAKVIASTSNFQHKQKGNSTETVNQTTSSAANISIASSKKRKRSDSNKGRIYGTDSDTTINKKLKNEKSPTVDSSNKETQETVFGIHKNSPDTDKQTKKKKKKKKKKPKI